MAFETYVPKDLSNNGMSIAEATTLAIAPRRNQLLNEKSLAVDERLFSTQCQLHIISISADDFLDLFSQSGIALPSLVANQKVFRFFIKVNKIINYTSQS